MIKEPSFETITALSVLIAVSTALYVTFQIGKPLVCGIHADRRPMPAWLEAVAPVRGRWLRLLLAGPAVAIFLVVVFLVALYFAMTAAWVLSQGVMALLGGLSNSIPCR
jgi:hypothetical protein